MQKNKFISLCDGFSKLSRKDREKRIIEMGFLSKEDLMALNTNVLNENLSESFIENTIGFIQLPLGVAVNFVIDDKCYAIPMAVEETSIVAGVSKIAKWVRDNGELTTRNLGALGIGQIQLPIVKNFNNVKQKIESAKHQFIEKVNQNIASGIVKRGGGLRDLVTRRISRGDGSDMAVIHLMIDTRDAMGANIINQICEYLKEPIESLTEEKVGLCILSNLADTKLTQAKVVIHNIDPDLGAAITEASLFAQIDPYRAATNNKGVLNGIDPILIATGNDWRAVEAGIHAYAGYSGQYTSITRWNMQGNDLVGVIEAPIVVGTVGGITQIHPATKICLKMLGVKTAQELARVIAAVGLVQNLAALHALVTVGIIEGHMRLHISNLILASDADQEELAILKQRLSEELKVQKYITGSDVKRILEEIRRKKREVE